MGWFCRCYHVSSVFFISVVDILKWIFGFSFFKEDTPRKEWRASAGYISISMILVILWCLEWNTRREKVREKVGVREGPSRIAPDETNQYSRQGKSQQMARQVSANDYDDDDDDDDDVLKKAHLPKKRNICFEIFMEKTRRIELWDHFLFEMSLSGHFALFFSAKITFANRRRTPVSNGTCEKPTVGAPWFAWCGKKSWSSLGWFGHGN